MTLQVGISGFGIQLPSASPRSFAREYRESLELIRLAEESGFDAAWVHEHHGTSDGFMSALLPTLAAWAAVTSRMKLGTAVLLTPFYHPLRLAEDAAAVDLISEGRLILGLGIAWRPEEFRMFEVPIRERVVRTVETIDILRRAWTGERFTYTGRVFRYEDVLITPRPAADPMPPIYVGAAAEKGVARAGRIADGFIGTQYTSLDEMKSELQLAEDAAHSVGKDPATLSYARLQNAFVWKEGEDLWEDIRPGVAHQIGCYPAWRAGADTPGKKFEIVQPSEEEMRQLTVAGHPQQVIDRLAPIVWTFRHKGDFHLIFRLHYPGMDFEASARAIELFGDRVIPALREIDTDGGGSPRAVET